MLFQVLGRAMITHAVKNYIDSFTARKLCGWHKICVSRDNDDLINLLFESQGRDIKPKAHIIIM
jgi:hypothetical protein